MRGKYKFREKFMEADSQLYITASQLQFYLNKPNGKKQFESGSKDFLNYLTQCQIYNAVYDCEDPEDAYVYWDHEKGAISIQINLLGKTYQHLNDNGIWFNGDMDDLTDEEIDELIKPKREKIKRKRKK